MVDTKLFETGKIKKFFNILEKLDSGIPIDRTNYRYKHYKTIYADSNSTCPRSVFVHRTVNRWLKGKALTIYRTSDLGITYKQYVSLSMLSYHNDWSATGYIGVGMIDYLNPYDSKLFGKEKFNHNTCLDLEGEWCNDLTKHLELLSMVNMDNVPEREFVFKAYDWEKYPKRVKKGTDPLETIKTTKSFKAKTYAEAYKLKNVFEEKGPGKFIISELVKVI